MSDWQGRAQGLADQLTANDQLHDPKLAAAITAVPRHALVPHFYRQAPDRSWTRVDATDPNYYDTVYGNTTLVTALADLGAGIEEPVSSSSQPSLMIRMLEALEGAEGMRVLEIGTGTGYNAALLAHQLGERTVFSVDVDPTLVTLASQRLAGIGYRPTLAVVDGAAGLPDHGPFHRIIATCSVPAIPWAWIEQLTDDGVVLADVKVQNTAGNLVLLRREGPRAVGRFAARYAAFMPLRHTAHATTPNGAAIAAAISHQPGADEALPERDTDALVLPTQQTLPWFLTALRLPVAVTFGYTIDPERAEPSQVDLYAADGSTSQVTIDHNDSRHRVTETGPTRLWAHVENAHRQWVEWGQPSWDRLGLTADTTTRTQMIWLDQPEHPIATLSP
ncbi:MAG: methyltransferase domain-containing protein [Pseudonocardiaceae bacterium]